MLLGAIATCVPMAWPFPRMSIVLSTLCAIVLVKFLHTDVSFLTFCFPIIFGRAIYVRRYFIAFLLVPTSILFACYDGEEDAYFFDFSTVAAFLLFFAVAGAFAQAQAAIDAVEADSKRKTLDAKAFLHNNSAHHLTDSLVQLEDLKLRHPELGPELTPIAESNRLALTTMRNAIVQLDGDANRKPTTASYTQGSFEAILSNALESLKSAGFSPHLTGDVVHAPTSTIKLEVLQRCLTEAINNIVKHAPKGSDVAIEASEVDSRVSLSITNPVKRRVAPIFSGKLGIPISREMLNSIGGNLEVHSSSDRWSTNITIPL